MKLFLSAGEPSGDLHGANLIAALKAVDPNVQITGFGGPRMAAAGSQLMYPLTDLAVMWFGRVLAHVPTFYRLAKQAETYFATEKPDAVVLIDYPGFHWHIAKRAKRQGVPVFYFVPPQLWAWAGWRVNKMRRTVDTVLTALPFEDVWYRERGVKTQFIGHPYFDELTKHRLDAEFIAGVKAASGEIIALLPGSRNQEVTHNFAMMASAARKIAAARPGVRFLVAAFNEKQAAACRPLLDGVPATVHVGKTPEIIDAANAAVSVSGSVGLELLYHGTPAVVVYKLSRLALRIGKTFKKCPYISLVNLLAGRELFPEFLTANDDSSAIAAKVLHWLENPAARAELVAALNALRREHGHPGACGLAAATILGRPALARAA
jgi:lipid-A-disaccharide synthase